MTVKKRLPGDAGLFYLLFCTFFLTVREPKYFFQDKAKTYVFFLNTYMLELYSFRFIRSCISWTQYTWVCCLYDRVYMYLGYLGPSVYEPRHDKTNKMAVRPAKTQISLGIRPVWSGSSLSAWRIIGSLDTHWAHSEDSDQTGRMPRLIWVFAGRTAILFVLSCRGSYINKSNKTDRHPPGIRFFTVICTDTTETLVTSILLLTYQVII